MTSVHMEVVEDPALEACNAVEISYEHIRALGFADELVQITHVEQTVKGALWELGKAGE